jgi:hypothetical protein
MATTVTFAVASTNTIIQIAELRDLSSFNDFDGSYDLTFREISGARVVLEWIARAWLSPQGSIEWAPNTGRDIRRLENADLPLADLERWRRDLQAEALKVPFVVQARVTIEVQNETNVVITGSFVLADGLRYPLVVTIDKAVEAFTAQGTA